MTASPFYPAGNPFLVKRNDFFPPMHSSSAAPPDHGAGEDLESRSAPSTLFLSSDFDKPLLPSGIKQHPTPLSPVPEQSDHSMHSSSSLGQATTPPLTYQPPPLTATSSTSPPLHSLTISKDWTPSTDILAQKIFLHDPTIISSTLNITDILSRNYLHRQALFVTMFCSILQAAFFSYLTNVSDNPNITLYLFFIRMFSDLIGRPMALIRPRIIFFQTIRGVLFGTMIRACCMALFFFYVFTPKEFLFRNDYMVLIFQVCLSLSLSSVFFSDPLLHAGFLFNVLWLFWEFDL
jgi:hypothetical protein